MNGDKLKNAEQAKQQAKAAQQAEYAQKMAQSKVDAIASTLKQSKIRPNEAGTPPWEKPVTPAGKLKSQAQQNSLHPSGTGERQPQSQPVEKPKPPQEKPKFLAGGKQSFADRDKVFRPGEGDKPPQSKAADAPGKAGSPPDIQYKNLPPGEQKFWKKLDKVAEQSREWHGQHDPKPGSERTRLREKSDGLDALPAEARSNLENGRHPRDAAFTVGDRLYFTNAKGEAEKWIDRKDIPRGNSRVVNGRLDSTSAQGGSGGGVDVWVRNTGSAIEVQPRYPEDKSAIEASLRKSRGKGLADAFGNASAPDPDIVRHVQEANHKLNGWMGDSLARGETLDAARENAWQNAMGDVRLASLKILSTAMGMATNGIRASFGTGGYAGGTLTGGVGRPRTIGRTRTPETAGPAAGEREIAPGVRIRPRGDAPAPQPRNTAGQQGPVKGADPASGKPRMTYAEGKLGEVQGNPEVSFVPQRAKGALGKPEASAKPGPKAARENPATQQDRDATIRAGVAEDIRAAQDKLPGAARTKTNTWRSKDTGRTRTEHEEPSPGMIQGEKIDTSYKIGLEGAKKAGQDGVQVLPWEPSTKMQGKYGKGIDDVGMWGDKNVILEWKGEGGKLSRDEMTNAWAGRKIAQLEVLGEPMAKTLLESARGGKLRGMVYHSEAAPGGGIKMERLDKTELKGTQGSRLKGERVSKDGVITYSAGKVERAYRTEKARLEQALKKGDRKALEVLMY